MTMSQAVAMMLTFFLGMFVALASSTGEEDDKTAVPGCVSVFGILLFGGVFFLIEVASHLMWVP